MWNGSHEPGPTKGRRFQAESGRFQGDGFRSQKSSEERKAMLEVEVYPDQAMNENQEIHGPEARDRRLASESTPVEQGQDFATSTGTLYREEMS